MAVAHDAATESATFTTTTPHTFSHTPAGTPRGVIVATVGRATGTSPFTSVTYGGVAVTQIARAFDVAGEPGNCSLWFLGAGIPTGTQTVSIVHTGTADVKIAWVATVTAATAETEIGVGGLFDNTGANPLVTIGKQSGLCYGTLFSGHDDIASLTPGAGCETIFSEDFGTDLGFFYRQSAEGAGVLPFGYAAAAEDGAVAGGLVIEKVAGVRATGAVMAGATTQTTSVIFGMAGDLNGHDLYVTAVSRDHTSGTALPTCTDTSGGNTWTLVSNDTDRQLLVWHKKGLTVDVNSALTVAGCVGSTTAAMTVVKGAAAGDPTTNLTVETNASGDETHASITPTTASSLVFFGVADVGNDTNTVTALAAATLGTMEPELFERLSSGGNDCRLTVTAKQSPGGPTATGNFTWTQADSTTKSVAFAIQPAPVGGAATGTVDWVGSATGVADHEGSAAGDLIWSGAPTGTADYEGSSTGSISWVGTADGEAPTIGTQEGAATDGSIIWSGIADGAAEYEGSAAGTITWTGTADGTAAHEGSATGTITWAGTAGGFTIGAFFWERDPVAFTPAAPEAPSPWI